MNDIIVPAAQDDGISKTTHLSRVDLIQRVGITDEDLAGPTSAYLVKLAFAELDEDRQEELADFAAKLLEEQRGGPEAPRPVTLTDARHAAERLGVRTADLAGALGFDD